MIVNRQKAECSICKVGLNPDKGFVYKKDGSPTTVCSGYQCVKRACPDQLQDYMQFMEKSKIREIDINGIVTIPHDRASRSIVEAMPGATYLSDNQWKVSLEMSDRSRVIELAKKLKLDIPKELSDYEISDHAKRAVKLAKKVGAHDFQIDGIKWLVSQKSCMLADDMGLGKSIQILISHNTEYGLLIVAPNHLKLNWKDEIIKWRPSLDVTIIKNGKYFKYPEPNEVVITTYGLLPWWLELPPKKRKNLMIEPEEIEAAKNVVVVYDEAQALKSNKTKQSRKARELSKYVHKSILLTGTPIMNREMELWNLFHAIRIENDIFGSFPGFLRLFRGWRGKYGYEFRGPRPEASEMLRKRLLRRTKSEVDIQLPDKVYKVIHVDVSSKAKKELDNVWDVYRRSKYFSDEELPPIEEMSKIKKSLAISKIPILKEVIKNLQEQDIVPLVFSAHIAPVKEIGKLKGFGTIVGSEMSSEMKHKVATDFQKGKYKGLAATILGAGTGLTLTYTGHVVFNDLDWVPANNLQAEDRACRIGQKRKKIVYYHLVADHPLDRHIHRLVLKKMELSRDTLETKIEIDCGNENDMTETEEDFQKRVEEVENSEQKKRTKAILSRLPLWEDLNIDKKWRVRKNHAKIIREEADKIVGKNREILRIKVEKDKVGPKSPYEARDARILNLLLAAGLETQTELRIAAGVLKKYRKTLGPDAKKMLKGIDTTQA